MQINPQSLLTVRHFANVTGILPSEVSAMVAKNAIPVVHEGPETFIPAKVASSYRKQNAPTHSLSTMLESGHPATLKLHNV